MTGATSTPIAMAYSELPEYGSPSSAAVMGTNGHLAGTMRIKGTQARNYDSRVVGSTGADSGDTDPIVE